jgi:hypothetical protein
LRSTILQLSVSVTRNSYILKDLSKQIEMFKNRLIENKADSAFIFIMGHGSNGEIELLGGVDSMDAKGNSKWTSNTANFILDIVDPFSETNFVEFVGKPKIFFDVSCQNFDASVGRPEKSYEDVYTDMLIAQACLPGQASNRDEDSGSLFVRILIEVFMRFCAEFRLERMLDLVRNPCRH